MQSVTFTPIDEAIERIREGEIVVVVDDEDRENEGDFILAAEHCTPEAITVLASTITLTPGTVSADMSNHGHSLLVHCLDAPDPAAVRDEIKERYERRLMEIFE